MVIADKIIFSIIAFYLFVYMFFKMIKKNDTVYVAILVMQAIGITINFIEIIFLSSFNIYLRIFVYLISIIIPIVIIILENKGKNVSELVKLVIAKIAFKFGNTKYAKKILLQIIEKYPNSYGAHRCLAEVYEKEGGMRKAIDEYVRAVDINKKDYDSYYKISFLLKDLGKKEDATIMLKNLLDKKPEYIDATLLLGDIYCEMGNYKEALNVYSGGLKYSPNNFDLYYSMGMAYTLLNDFQNAKICYEKAATVNNLMFKSYYNIAQINLISNDLDEAEKYFTKTLEEPELEADAYYHLGKIAMLRGDHENAIKLVNMAIKLDNKYIKIATKDSLFIPVVSRFDIPIIDEEDIVEKKQTLNPIEKEVKIHLEKTYKVVDMLNMAKTRVAKKKQIEKVHDENERDK